MKEIDQGPEVSMLGRQLLKMILNGVRVSYPDLFDGIEPPYVDEREFFAPIEESSKNVGGVK